jgi:transposase-like protein
VHPRADRGYAGGRKELVGFTDGARESAHDWRNLLLDLKRRGLQVPPELAIADGGLSFSKAAGEIWPKTREQRCWVHKTANVLAKLPKSQQPKAKRALQEIWMAETKIAAAFAFDAFVQDYQLKYTKAAECLAKDRDALLVFYDFPAEHWKHLRTTNPIESTFATVRHRKRLPLQQDRARHGLQAGRGRATCLAPPRLSQPVAKGNPWCEIR